MAEFETAAELSLTLGSGEAEGVRRQIERELGDVSVGTGGTAAPTGGGGAVGARGPEPASIDLSRQQLGQQETLVELAERRNELLEDMGEGGGGGGGVGAGTGFGAGLAARAGIGGISLGPFGALAGLTALGLGGAALAGGPGGDGPAGPGPGAPPDGGAQQTTRFGVGQERRLMARIIPPEIQDRRGDISRPAPTIENRFEITATANANVEGGISESVVSQIAQREARRIAAEIQAQIENSVSSGTPPTRQTGVVDTGPRLE